MADSDFICLDEPFKGLDSATKEKVMAYVKKCVEGKTVLLITHNSREAEFFSGEQHQRAPIYLTDYENTCLIPILNTYCLF
jgi:ABC-type nitrate/sulfonate/bicarbonate transport system ATPase subunit